MAGGEYPNGGNFKKTSQIVSRPNIFYEKPNHIWPGRKKVSVVVLKELISMSVSDILTATCAHGTPFCSPFSPDYQIQLDHRSHVKTVPPGSISISLSLPLDHCLDGIASCLTQRIKG
jgi:hypothetical protein